MVQPAQTPEPIDDAGILDRQVDEAIALCGGDTREALKATLIANAFLESEIERLCTQISAGFARGRVRRRSAQNDEPDKSGGGGRRGEKADSLPEPDAKPVADGE